MNGALAGRTAIVMGAGSVGPGWSNGKAVAASYARAGANTVCVDFVEERAAETAAVICARGGSALAVVADATDESSVRAVVQAALDEFGQVDILHNNVGVGGSFGTPETIKPEEWAREFTQNVSSAYLGIRCVVPTMREQGRGVIINTSSTMAVRFLRRPNVAYSASKAAVEAMTKACAVAYGRDNIRVNCLRIGFSETPLMMAAVGRRGLDDAGRQAVMHNSREKVPLRGEHASGFDVGAAAVFLASDAAGYLTGVVLDVDGGLVSAPL